MNSVITRRRAAALAVALALSVVLEACGASASEGPEVWRFAIEETQGSVQDTYAQEFARRVAERTGGEVVVKVYPYGSLGTSDDLTEQLRMGSLQFAMASPGHLGKTIPELQVFLLHFLLSDDDGANLAALRDPAIRELLEPLFLEKGLALVDLLPEGWMVWTTQRPVRAPEDFEGIKIRTMTSPLLLAAYEAYGASPQAMPYGEVYSALQLNMIDAQVNPMFAIEEMSFYEVTSHLVRARPAPFLTTLVTNASFLEGLAPERRAVLEEVAAELLPFVDEAQRTLNEERLAEMLERKPSLEVIELSEEERGRFRERALPVRDLFRERTGERGARLLAALEEALERASSGG